MTRQQDTGGQNIRWKQAADNVGSEVLKALIHSAGQDSGGVAIRYQLAANGDPRLSIRAVHASDTYIKYPTDIRWSGNEGAIQRLYAEADVIHLNNYIWGYLRFDKGQRKPTVLHHHGSVFRSDPRRHLQLAKRHNMESAVSTIDLMKPAPELLTWLPTAYNLAELRAIRGRHRRPADGKVRIAHAPTDRGIKSTDALIAAVDALKAEGLPVELDVIEGVSWAQCLARKAAADIYFDQVQLGYGCNAVEAWGMGMPVIAGAAPWTLDRMGKEFGGVLPFYTATEDTILDAVRVLVTSVDARAEYVEHGTNHVERFHAERPALERLLGVYLKAIARRKPKRSRVPSQAA